MLVELSVVEQRYLAVREALDTGATITDVARRYGVDRRTVHRWLLRYAAGGLGALADRSSKPDRCPHQIPPEVEARIVALRRSNPGWGPRTILSRLRRELDDPPSRSAIYRCLVRHRLIAPKLRRRRREDYRRWERSRAMELWQIDVMGGIRLDDGTQFSVVTGIDDHSRFCVIAKLVPRATARPVCDALMEGLSRHGVPDQILTDNGKVFTGKLARKPANVLFDRICLNNGVRHLLTAPYSPTTTGKIERLHKTMRREFFARASFGSIEQAQEDLDRWVWHYNHHREHQGIGDVAPIRRFELAENRLVEVVDPRPSSPPRPRRQDGSPGSGAPTGETDHGRRGPAEGRPERIGELRGVRLPGGQLLLWPDRRGPPGGRHRADHSGRRAAANAPSSTRQEQGVRGAGEPNGTTTEGSRCRIGAGADSGHGYRVLTLVVLRVMLDTPASPDP